MNYKRLEKRILKETEKFAFENDIYYNCETKSMLQNAMREVKRLYEGVNEVKRIDLLEKGSLHSEQLTSNPQIETGL